MKRTSGETRIAFGGETTVTVIAALTAAAVLAAYLPTAGKSWAMGAKTRAPQAEKKAAAEENAPAAPVKAKENRVVARIGDQEIRDSDIDRVLETMPTWVKRSILSEEDRNRFIHDYVASQAIYRKAKKLGVDKSPEIQSRLEDITRQLSIQKYLTDQVTTSVKVTDEDLKKSYEEEKSKYLDPAKIKISFIRCGTKEKAETVLAELKTGKDFAQLAKDNSEDKATAEKGGAVDRQIEEGGMIPGLGSVPEVNKVLSALAPGAYTAEPVETRGAFFIFRLDERTPPRQKEFAEVETIVRGKLTRQKESEFVEKMIKNIYAEEKVEVLVPKPPEPHEMEQ